MKAITVQLRLLLALIASIALMVPMATTVEAAVGLNLDQCANDALANLAIKCGTNPAVVWQNGNINGSNSQYREGDGLPYRNAITGLTNGTWVVRIDYDFTQGGKFAVDRLTKYDLTQASNPCANTTDVTCTEGSPAFTFEMPGEVASPGVTQPALPNSGILAIPAPPGGLVDTLAERSMTVWVNGGGTGAFVSAGQNSPSFNDGFVVQNGSASGNSNRQFAFKFTLSGCPVAGCNVMMGWTGHIASSAATGSGGWGAAMGAGFITGAPFHMRIVGVDQNDGTSGGNQDRSVQLSALVAPGQATLTVIKHVVGGPAVASDFTMTINGNLTLQNPPASFPGDEAGVDKVVIGNFGAYDVTESSVADYTASFSADCDSTIAAGQTKTCTVTNTFQGPLPTGIPTLSEWGMIGMAFVLAGAAIWYLRSRPMRLT